VGQQLTQYECKSSLIPRPTPLFSSRHWSVETQCWGHRFVHLSVHAIRNAHGAGVPNVITGFAYEYTYQDQEYIIRTMNIKHVQCTCYTFIFVSIPSLYVRVFLLQAAHKIALSCPKYIFNQVVCTMLTNNQL